MRQSAGATCNEFVADRTGYTNDKFVQKASTNTLFWLSKERVQGTISDEGG